MHLFRLIATLAIALMLSSPVAAANTPVFPQTPKILVTHFVQGTDSAGTYKTIYTGGANGSKILGIYVATTDGTATHVVTAALSSSTTDHCATATTCAIATTYTTATANANLGAYSAGLLVAGDAPQDSDGNAFLYMTGATQTLEATFATALTASTKISIIVIAVDF